MNLDTPDPTYDKIVLVCYYVPAPLPQATSPRTTTQK